MHEIAIPFRGNRGGVLQKVAAPAAILISSTPRASRRSSLALAMVVGTTPTIENPIGARAYRRAEGRIPHRGHDQRFPCSWLLAQLLEKMGRPADFETARRRQKFAFGVNLSIRKEIGQSDQRRLQGRSTAVRLHFDRISKDCRKRPRAFFPTLPAFAIPCVQPHFSEPFLSEMKRSLCGNFSNSGRLAEVGAASTSAGLPAIHCDRSIVS